MGVFALRLVDDFRIVRRQVHPALVHRLSQFQVVEVLVHVGHVLLYAVEGGFRAYFVRATDMHPEVVKDEMRLDG